MILRTDHCFHIGEQHLKTGKPCQDYALSGVLGDGLHYGIVSDGCSSGGMTDIGARLMSLALKQALSSGPHHRLVDRLGVYLETMGRSLALSTTDLLATGLVAVANEQQFVSTVVLGDGVMVERSTYGTLHAHKYEWSDNAPFYPAYTQSQRREFLDHKPTLTHEVWSISGPDDWHHHQTVEESAYLAMRNGITWSYEPPHGPWGLAGIGIFSDGVQQVDGTPWQQVVWELMNFKSTKGQFATRRMNRFLTEIKETGRGPIDDIAMAVITFDAA